ncbi:MAG: Uma2 family endonuclease [Bacteroidota bacterium]
MTRVLSELDILGTNFDWTIERYHNAIAAGVLTEYDKVELIKGRIIKKMPISEDHSGVVENLTLLFFELLGRKFRYRSENPITLPNDSEPEPDFVVAKKLEEGEKSYHPRPEHIHLVIEVANETLDYDRKVKAKLYAEAGIKEYWIINIKFRKVEVYSSPSLEDGSYESVINYEENADLHSPFLGSFPTKKLLPIQ